MPWYDDFNNIMGIFGCSIFVDMKIIDMTAQLNFITSHFLIDQKDADQSISKQCIYGIYYTKREMEIIKWVIRGRTMAEIGTQLNLSNRTIQNYFETIKLKAGVKNKSAFIDLVMPYFYQSLVD